MTFIADIEANIGSRPPGHTLDRVDNDGNYEVGNVKWSTWSEQMRNRAPFSAKLSPELIAEARARRQGGEVLRVLAEDYGVSIATMHRYVTGQRSGI